MTHILTGGLAALVAIAGLAGGAAAQTVCDADVLVAIDNTTPLGPTPGCDRIWGDEPDEAFIVINGLLFVTNTKLTILDGTIVRGNTRSEPTGGVNPFTGAPGTLIVTRGAFLDARGNPGNPIIFTTAAVDNDDNGVPDDVVAPICGVGCYDDWQPGDKFLDDTPATNPLSTLLSDGTQATLLHGGLVLNGFGPTNLDDTTTGVEGEGFCEGIPVPNPFPNASTFGGFEPHDSSGALEYVSVRHAGDEIAAANELNGITFCGVGDGTIVSHVEAYANGDDGFEMFGGTVNLRNVVVAYTGDDAIDVDQGYAGTLQDVFTLTIFYNENGGGDVGTGGSGDAHGEFDGEDCPTCIIGGDGFVVPNPAMVASNWTYVGNVEGALNSGITNPAVSAASDNEGIQSDTEWDGIIANTLCVGFTGGGQPCIENDGSGRQNALIVSSSGDFTLDAGAAVLAANGDAAVAAGVEFTGGNANVFPVGSQLLVNENHYFVPTGVAVNGRGKLIGAKTDDAGNPGGPPMNPRPLNPASAAVSGGIEPHWPGMDRSETYKGAFPDSADLWVEPWSAISIGGIVD
jgi:hypothetical protein